MERLDCHQQVHSTCRGDLRTLILSTEANRKRVFLCLCCGVFAQFSGTSLTGYYLHNILEDIGIDSPNYQNKLNGFILMVNMIEAWVWACCVDRFGRRPLFLVRNSICGVPLHADQS